MGDLTTMRKGPDDPAMALKALGSAIVAARIRQGFTREELAEAAELDLETLEALETGSLQPELQHLFRIALALEQHPQALFESARDNHAVARLMSHADVLFDLYRAVRQERAS